MRTLIVLVVGLLAVGCGKEEHADTDESTPTTNTNKANGPRVQPDGDVDLLVKEPIAEEKALKDSVAGEYMLGVQKYVFLKNGILEWYENGKMLGKAKWAKSNGQIHIKLPDGRILATRMNKDKSITCFAIIDEGRTDLPKEAQWTYKRIK